MGDLVYLGFTNGASRHTQNLASVTWVIYYPSGQLLIARGTCISLASNNIVEYSVAINLLFEAISFGIESYSLVVYLDSRLVVSQLNNIYCVRDSLLHRQFLRVRLFQISFTYLTFIHIQRPKNSFVDSIANQALDWNINHSSHSNHNTIKSLYMIKPSRNCLYLDRNNIFKILQNVDKCPTKLGPRPDHVHKRSVI